MVVDEESCSFYGDYIYLKKQMHVFSEKVTSIIIDRKVRLWSQETRHIIIVL